MKLWTTAELEPRTTAVHLLRAYQIRYLDALPALIRAEQQGIVLGERRKITISVFPKGSRFNAQFDEVSLRHRRGNRPRAMFDAQRLPTEKKHVTECRFTGKDQILIPFGETKSVT